MEDDERQYYRLNGATSILYKELQRAETRVSEIKGQLDELEKLKSKLLEKLRKK